MTGQNTFAVQGLIVKMKNPDADLRFMALTDLMSEIERCGGNFGVDDGTEHGLVEQVLALMHDANGEVKNLAVKALAALVRHVSEVRIMVIIDRLVKLSTEKEEGTRDIASLGLKTVVTQISPKTTLAHTVSTRLVPKLIDQLQGANSSPALLIDCLDLLSDILSRFEATVKAITDLQKAVLSAVTPLLDNARPAVRKRAVTTLAVLVASYEVGFTKLVTGTVVKTLQATNTDQLRTSVSLVGALAKTAPQQMGKQAPELIPLILGAATAHDDDELKEGVLLTLETLVLKCPTETGPFINQIVDAGTSLIKYDPNWAADDEDEDIEMGDDDDEDEDDDFDDDDLDEDDDDVSFKVRRAATKLLGSCVATRSDLLAQFYKTIAPTLLSRFGEREETVRVEVWAAFTSLLNQTKVYSVGGLSSISSGGSDSGSGRLKRKRSGDSSPMEVEDGPIGLLRALTPAIAKSMMKQLTVKSLATRQAGFNLLRSLVTVLSGGVETQMAVLVQRVEGALKASDTGLSGTATSLKIEVLSLLGLIFKTHYLASFSDELSKLVPLVVGAVGDKFNKVAAEAFVTATELVRVLRPISPVPGQVAPGVGPYLNSIYEVTSKRLSSSDADEEVKAKGLGCLGALLVHAGDVLADKRPAALSLLQDRLRNEVSRLVAVRVVADVAASPLSATPELDAWVHQCLIEVANLLRKVNRPLKLAAFGCLNSLLGRAGADVPAASAQALLADLEPLLTAEDANLLPLAVSSVTALLNHSAETLPAVQHTILPRALELVRSPLVQGHSLDALLGFFVALVTAGAEPVALVQALSAAADSQGQKEVDASGVQTGMSALTASSRSIGVVVREVPGVASGVVAEYANVVKNSKSGSSPLILGLLTLGEIGRAVDVSSNDGLFETVVGHFSSASEDVRRAAAFAAGNIAVGNPAAFLPPIIQLIQTDDKKRYLALNALKEVISHSSPEALALISDSLWTPLFDNCEAQEEGTRNVAADCLGQLTVINPAKYLPQLEARLSSPSRHTRATVIAAIRFTFTNDSSAYDQLLAPLIVEFFRLMNDADLGVRRLALSSLNSAAHNKAHLVRDHLASLLPALYAQTVVDERLIRIVEMGPFKHKVDDGLDIRKTAYECMHTLLDSALQEIDVHELLGRVVSGLNDEEDVKKLCYLMLAKLAQVAPTAVAQRLDDTVASFTATLEATLKDTAVKQETERLVELQKAALRCLAVLNRLASPANAPKFGEMVRTVLLSGKWATEYKELAQNAAQRSHDTMEY